MARDAKSKAETAAVIRTFPLTEGEDPFAQEVARQGLDLLDMPLIETVPVDFVVPRPLSHYDWLVFTSKNGVKSWQQRFANWDRHKIAVIGPPTARAAEALGASVAFCGSGHSGAVFAEELLPHLKGDEKVLLALGRLARPVLADKLISTLPNLVLERVDVYETRGVAAVDAEVLERIRSGRYHCIAVSSPSAVDRLILALRGEQLGAATLQELALCRAPLAPELAALKLRLVSIGVVTSEAIRAYGLEPWAEAEEQSYAGLGRVCGL